MRKISAILWLLFMICQMTAAQQLIRPFGREMAFIEYLQNKSHFQDAILAIDAIPVWPLNQSQRDSLHYYKGWAYYQLKILDSSAQYLLQVSHASPFHLKSGLFGAYNYIYLKKYDAAKKILTDISFPDNMAEVGYFEKSGIALLQKDFTEFNLLKEHFSYDNYALTAQEHHFIKYRDQLIHEKKKSPFLAGLMSAVVPGTGKIYAGKTYQGIGTMFPMAALGLLTYESYHKKGFNSVPFYLFGSLLAVYYVGNIWGSVFAVKITREEHEKLIYQKVLLDLQIPLRTIFN